MMRWRRQTLDLRPLTAPEGERYLSEFQALDHDFAQHPEASAARARGLVEEVLRRMGFPDRIDRRQKVRDLARHDRDAGRALAAADGLLHAGADADALHQAVSSYRRVLDRLLRVEVSAS